MHVHSHFVLGVAPGPPALPTAIAVVEQHIKAGETLRLGMRHLDRLPAGAAMGVVGTRVLNLAQLLDREDESGDGPEIIVDASLLGPQWRGRFGPSRTPMLVGIDAPRPDGGVRLNRLQLVTPMIERLQEGTLRLAQLPLTPVLEAAMHGFAARASRGDEDLEAARASADELLVVALALATWRASHHAPGPGTGGAPLRARVPERLLY